MSRPVDYFFTPQSPWAYLGHARFVELLRASRRAVRVLPVDYGRIFPLSGGLPLGQRAPQRQAYRLQELARWKAFLGVPLNTHPRYFPADATLAACVIAAAPADARLALAGDFMRAVWVEEANIADPATVAAIAARHGIADAAAAAARGRPVYEANTQEAVARQVFGAPTYAYGDELFWGQDRLDFLDRALND